MFNHSSHIFIARMEMGLVDSHAQDSISVVKQQLNSKLYTYVIRKSNPKDLRICAQLVIGTATIPFKFKL